MWLQIFRLKAGVFGEAGEHLRPDFFTVMECKNHVRPAGPRQNPMGSAVLPFDGPTNAEQSCQDTPRFA
jgi:hypothetical protein